MSAATLAVAVLAACALAWRRHRWHVQAENMARIMAPVCIAVKASTDELEAALRRFGEALSAVSLDVPVQLGGAVTRGDHAPRLTLGALACWRCDASPADDDRLGLCQPCHADLIR